MASNPAVLGSLMPGANIGGSSVAIPSMPMSAAITGMPSIGGNSSPFLPASTTGSNMPTMTTSGGFPANTGAGVGGSGGIPGQLGAGFGAGTPGGTALFKGLMQAGLPAGIAGLLDQFLSSGAGYNSQVAQDLIAQLQPQINAGANTVMEQFSAMGNRFGSPAAAGLANYESQAELNVGEILSNLYESSVQNYMSVLGLATQKKPQTGGVLGTLAQALGPLSNIINTTGQLPGVPW